MDLVTMDDGNSAVFNYVLVKVASRCNIACSYCYWFRDASVYELPKILPLDVEDKFLERLEIHIRRHRFSSFAVIFHGGEPLLFGKARLRSLCSRLAALEQSTGCRIRQSITTNGVLIDQQWVDLFREAGVSVTLSLDGNAEEHDRQRIDFRGRGTYARVLQALALLRRAGIEPGILAVCNPNGSPAELCRTFVEVLNLKRFDVLIPDATHDDQVDSIERYYKELFDLWYDTYSHQGVEIGFVENMLRGAIGLQSTTEAIGYGPVSSLTMLTDGSLEPLDVLRIAGTASTKSAFNVHDHDFQDMQSDERWSEARRASLQLCATCEACTIKEACGGGYLPSRWSKARRYDNPSVYCEDLKGIFGHIWQRVSPSLYVAPGSGPAIADKRL